MRKGFLTHNIYGNKNEITISIKDIVGAMLSAVAMGAVGAYIQFSKHPELYPIGEGELSWSYESFENYAFTCRAAIGWNAIGFVASACYRFRHSGKILLVHFLLTLLLCCWNCMVIYG